MSLEYFIFGYLVTAFLLSCWFKSTLFLHILGLIFDDVREDWLFNDLIDWIDEKNSYLADLLSCELCLGFWVGLAAGIILNLFLTVEWWGVIVGAMSWSYINHKIEE